MKWVVVPQPCVLPVGLSMCPAPGAVCAAANGLAGGGPLPVAAVTSSAAQHRLCALANAALRQPLSDVPCRATEQGPTEARAMLRLDEASTIRTVQSALEMTI
jgi:hypothetical protein